MLDDLERALAAAADHEEAKVIEGVEMTKSALAAALASEGLEEIEAEGAFDPHVHEALLAQPVEGVEPGVDRAGRPAGLPARATPCCVPRA